MASTLFRFAHELTKLVLHSVCFLVVFLTPTILGRIIVDMQYFTIISENVVYVCIHVFWFLLIIAIMTIRDRLHKKKSLLSPQEEAEIEQKASKIVEQISETIQQSSTPYIAIQATRSTSQLSPCTSKFGGTPYLPVGQEYPYHPQTKKPLFFLAQIRFDELPSLPNLPKTGMLQIFIDPKIPYVLQPSQPYFNEGQILTRYYEKVRDHDQQTDIKLPSFADDDPPFSSSFRLSYEKRKMTYTTSDIHLIEIVELKTRDLPNALAVETSVYGKLEASEVLREMTEKNSNHQIGGYPTFIQSDPREIGKDDHLQLLLQIDSQVDSDRAEILWGDAGIAQFFIDPQDLRNHDFSHIKFHWDCG